MKYQVIVPLARVSVENGFESFTHGDLIEIKDEAEAKRMIAAGIIALPGKGAKVDRSQPFEAAVKFGKKE